MHVLRNFRVFLGPALFSPTILCHARFHMTNNITVCILIFFPSLQFRHVLFQCQGMQNKAGDLLFSAIHVVCTKLLYHNLKFLDTYQFTCIFQMNLFCHTDIGGVRKCVNGHLSSTNRLPIFLSISIFVLF